MIIDLTKKEISTIVQALDEMVEKNTNNDNSYAELSDWEIQNLVMELKLKVNKSWD